MASLSVRAKQCKISSPLDSRDARFEFWSFDFSQKPILSRKHDAAQIQFEQFLNQRLEWIVSNFLLHSILEMSDSSSEGLISVKNRLLCRKHDAPQIHFELIFWMNCVKFSSPYDSRHANFGLRTFKFIQETNCWDTTGKERWYMQ